MNCIDCGKRHGASGGRCLTCKTAVRRMFRDAKSDGWTIDQAGGCWWVWDRIGNVLAMHDKSSVAALRMAIK